MKASELNPNPDLSIPALPVVCDRCKAEGAAGDATFSAIPDILGFDPVPRRARADGWRPEHQRAFIAALAITGSPRIAARTIGKHAFGAESLRTARGGRGFAAAWDAALDLAREREFERIRDNLGELAGDTQAALARLEPDPDDERNAEDIEHAEALDGAPMATIGWIIVAEADIPSFEACEFEGLPFVRTGADPFRIKMPKVTPTEIREMERRMPDLGAGDLEWIPENERTAFLASYRYLPNFAPIEAI